jgi:hypothetical protein
MQSPSLANIPFYPCELWADWAELTWLAKRRDILVLSLGFLVMWQMSCSMGVMPETQFMAGQLSPVSDDTVPG